MKVVAFYLPQFHEVPENNEWWGEGFTEWTNIKKANSLFKGHNQPREPINDNYYNVLEKKTVEWQVELANKHNIFGFCYYHYWFEGRMILEKPAENLLKWKDINTSFCFCWANHSWRKTWNGTNEMLINQDYGDEGEWKEHFEYLLKFFKDDRYIKIDNMPVFVIYSSKDIKSLDDRINYYNLRCIENGFKGIYIIESLNKRKDKSVSKESKGILLREPSIAVTSSSLIDFSTYVLKRSFKKNYFHKPKIFDGNKLYKKSLKAAKKVKSDKNIFLGSFTSWDSTPRHENRGYIIKNTEPEKFGKYLSKQKEMIKNNKEEIIFLNAWNEWAEGMYLEPDKKFGYGYLEEIKKTVKKGE